MSRMEERWEASKNELVEAARNAGVDAAIVVKIAGFESGYNTAARPISSSPTQNRQRQFDGVMAISTAHGYGQFLNGTWKDMLNQHGEKYGVANASAMTMGEANTPTLRNDTRLQAAMLAEFTRANVAKGSKLGGPDADANVYAFHNLGDGDATKLLNALRHTPNQRIDQILSGRVIEGNPSLYGDGSRTVTQAYQAMGKAMDKYEKYAMEAAKLTAQSADPLHEIRQIGERIEHGEPIYRSSLKDGLPDFLRVRQSSSPASEAMRDGTLRNGEKGPMVRTLQEHLNELGFADGRGHTLAVDGSFGRSTHEAVENFQLWNGLPTTGIADPGTLELLRGLRNASHSKAPRQFAYWTPADPNHPDHDLLEQIRKGVRTEEERIGKVFDEASERISRCLLAACKDNMETHPQGSAVTLATNALTRVDHVLFGNTGRIFAVEGRLDDPSHKLAHVSAAVAAQTPVEQSDQKLHAANLAIAHETATAQHAQPTPGMQDSARNAPALLK